MDLDGMVQVMKKIIDFLQTLFLFIDQAQAV
jgi:hypothetical protein